MANAKQIRAAETRRNQRAAKQTLHPRCLARSVAKAMGCGDEWREECAKLPRRGQKYLYPERHKPKEEKRA